MVVAAQPGPFFSLFQPGPVVLVVGLLGRDGDGLERPALDLVQLVLDPAVALVQVRRRQQPVAAREAVMLEVELRERDGLPLACKGELDRSVDLAEGGVQLPQLRVRVLARPAVRLAPEQPLVVLRRQLHQEPVGLHEAADHLDAVGLLAVAQAGLNVLPHRVDEVVAAVRDLAVAHVVRVVPLVDDLGRHPPLAIAVRRVDIEHVLLVLDLFEYYKWLTTWCM
ncbi:hypothetical protein PG995_005156 [Apiospora arundinis]